MQKYLTVSSLSHHRIAVSLLLKPVVIAVSQSIRNFWCQTLGEISCVISECFRVDSFPTKGKWIRWICVKLVSSSGETTAANCHPGDRAFRPEILPDVGGDTRHKRRHFFLTRERSFSAAEHDDKVGLSPGLAPGKEAFGPFRGGFGVETSLIP